VRAGRVLPLLLWHLRRVLVHCALLANGWGGVYFFSISTPALYGANVHNTQFDQPAAANVRLNV
jgi:hypothetical protein